MSILQFSMFLLCGSGGLLVPDISSWLLTSPVLEVAYNS